jgi:hypothetical protein
LGKPPESELVLVVSDKHLQQYGASLCILRLMDNSQYQIRILPGNSLQSHLPKNAFGTLLQQIHRGSWPLLHASCSGTNVHWGMPDPELELVLVMPCQPCRSRKLPCTC